MRIIPVGGIELVKKFYKFLALPISENIEDQNKGKVFCLTDTDANLRKNDIIQEETKLQKSLIIKRLADNKEHITDLIKFEIQEKQNAIDIEKSLNPIIFKETLDELKVEEKFLIIKDNIQNIDGNTTIENLRNFNIKEYFFNEVIKNDFAKKYIEIMQEKENANKFVPKWIKEIQIFFK